MDKILTLLIFILMVSYGRECPNPNPHYEQYYFTSSSIPDNSPVILAEHLYQQGGSGGEPFYPSYYSRPIGFSETDWNLVYIAQKKLKYHKSTYFVYLEYDTLHEWDYYLDAKQYIEQCNYAICTTSDTNYTTKLATKT